MIADALRTRYGVARGAARLCAALLTAAVLVLTPVTATAQDDPPTRADVYGALGLAEQSADYVVLVDVSGSMAKDGLYDSVRSTLRSFLQGMSPRDHVALFTFDAKTQPRYVGPARPVDKIVAALPDTPTPGGDTDIGEALNSALTQLETSGSAPVASVVLLTDGEHAPADGSHYPKNTGAPWDALHRRAQALAKGTDLSGYALPLRTDVTGAALLGTVVPATTVLKPDGIGDLRGYLAQATARTQARKAATLLAGDIGKGVTAAWTGPPQLDLTDGPVTGRITLTSADRHAPLTVTGLTASLDGTGSDTELTVTPDRLTLKPGASQTVDVRIDGSLPAGWNPARHTEDVEAALEIGGTVTSTWAKPLASQVDLRVPARVRTTDGDTVRVSQTVGSPLVLPVAAALAVLVVLVLWLRWLRTNRPRLHGDLLLQPAFGQQIPDQIALRGRRVRLRPAGVGGRGRVHGRRQRADGERRLDLVISYSPDGTAGRTSDATCRPDGQVVVNGVTFTYRAPTGGIGRQRRPKGAER